MTQSLLQRRRERMRIKLRKVASGRPRLSVHRTNCHIYAQIIDDTKSVTVVAASSNDKEVRAKVKNGGNKAAAAAIGKIVAEKAVKAGIKEVVFDRSGFLFHGRVKALADAAREAGLNF